MPRMAEDTAEHGTSAGRTKVWLATAHSLCNNGPAIGQLGLNARSSLDQGICTFSVSQHHSQVQRCMAWKFDRDKM